VRDNKLWVAGHRLHHGLTGCAFVVVGAVLALHDRADYKKWVPDFLTKEKDES
jgi:hypothetical protein